jgi:rhodanese-related sulfurtransferase/peroxiredoxin
MRISFFLQSFFWPMPLSIGSVTPRLSLTSQDGAWIRSEDFKDRWNLILLFLSDPTSQEQLTWIRQFDKIEFETTKVFAICSTDTKTMREFREEHNLQIDFLYDPLSLEARRFGMGKRRPISVTGILVVNTQQQVSYSARKMVDLKEIMPQLRNEQSSQEQSDSISSEDAVILIQSGHILIDVRTRSEYEAHHSPDAIHIPIEDLSSQLDALPQKSKLIFICQAGERAVAAAELLRSVGATEVFVVAGGMTNWNGPQQHGVSSS